MIFDAYMIEYISHLLTIKFDAKEDLAVYSTKFVRYLDYEYCKQFYDDGRLRLTNIRVFRSYDNEYQGDLNEGIYTKNSIFLGKYRMKAIAEYGGNAYILCGTINDTKALRAVFKASSGVEIRNLPAFADDILSSNPEIQLLVADKCKYNDEDPFIENMVKRGVKIGKNGHLLFSQKIVEEEIGKHFSIMDLFMKHSNYKYQQEYRFIVNLPGDEDFALIKTSKQKHYSRMVSF
jgi:hypothetical protein